MAQTRPIWPSSAPAEPRFEFRCWGDSLAKARDVLESRWHRLDETAEEDVYYLGGTGDLTLKSRSGRFQVKERIARRGDLEQWDKVADIPFPAPLDDIVPWLQRAFALTAPQEGEGAVDQTMLDAWLRRQDGVTVAAVTKARTHYRLSVLMGEHTRVSVAGRHAETVAVESTDFAAVEWARRALGLAERVNEAYPAALSRFLETGESPP